jgi:hypothetical protein
MPPQGDADKLTASGAAADQSFSSEPAGTPVLDCPLMRNWLEIELVGPDGNAMAFEPYEIRLTNRTVLSGKLDAAGFQRVEHLPAGQHQVSFPRYQGEWVQLELVDQDGQPVANEPFEVEDSNGNVRKGVLDEKGFGEVGGLAPGECQVSFPERQWKHWLQLEVVRENGAPASGAPYRVHDPGGRVVVGSLDENGFAEITGLHPGECEVEFPEAINSWLSAS